MSIGLAVQAGDGLQPLAPWVRWLRNLGSWAGQMCESEERHSVLITVPSREYAAAFVLLGVAEALYEREPDPAAHWSDLRALPPGTWVRHLDRGRYYTCSQVQHVFTRGKDEWLQLTGAYARRWDKCADVQPLPEGEEPFNQRRAPREHAFLRAVLPDVDSRAYCAGGEPLALAITSKALLMEELSDTRVAVTDGVEAGSLQDLVRARVQSGSPYRCDVVAATSEELPARTRCRVPVAVLDGATAALRWRHRVDSGAAITILDRTAASFDAAVEAVLADRARSLEDVPLTALGDRPAGVEALAYLERR